MLSSSSCRWPGTRTSKFFSTFLLCFCWLVCWLLTNTVSNQWRGAPMESKLPAPVVTEPSRFGTRELGIASRPWPATRTFTFSFFQVFPPQVFPSLLLLIRVLISHNFRVCSVAWSSDGKQIASGSLDKTIKVWDSQFGDCHSTLTGHSST